MLYRLCLVVVIGLGSFTASQAEELSKTISFSTKDMSFERSAYKNLATGENYDIVRLKDCELTNQVGEPQLPVYIARIVLPQGATVKKVRAKSLGYEDLPDKYFIYPAQPPQILSKKDEDIVFVSPSDAVYNSANPYPSELIKFLDTGYLGGYQIASFLVYPIQYFPKDRKLRIHNEIEFVVHFEQNKAVYPLKAKYRSHKSQKLYEDLVKSLALNPDNVQPLLYKSIPANGYEYVIITGSHFASSFEPLAQWNTKKGIPTVIKTTSWIYSNFDGKDEAEQVRNFIKVAYQDSGLVWVLLAGDVEVVPDRIAFAMDCEYGYRPDENDLRCDLYYADLDGNWDANENGVYGEIADEVDLYPEVFVGRAPASSISDVNTFVNKVLTYEKNPDPDYLLNMLFCAEILWPNPYTDAGVGKNMIEEESVPSQFEVTKLYQSMGNENTSSVVGAINAGHHFINHDGHGWISIMGVLDNHDVDGLYNGPRNSIAFSLGCWTNAFHCDDCIGEHFINNTNGGCVAYIGNTSYGWGSPGNSGYGYTDRFDSRLYHSMFLDKNYNIGKALTEAKAYYAALSRTENVYRWHQYELNLLGDPTMEIWTNTPESLDVVYPDSICEGTSMFMVKVQNQAGQPIDNALVCIMKDSEIYEYGHTDNQGEIKFTINASPGSLLVTATAHNFYPYEGTSKVFTTGPYVSYYSHTVNDTVGGNGNGFVNPGETVKLNVLLKNFGNESADTVTTTLRTSDALVTITDSSENFGNISAGDTAWSVEGFSFDVAEACTNGYVVNFSLEIKSANYDFGSFVFGITVATPILVYQGYSVNDSTGNNNGVAEPGETIDIIVSVKNQGLCEAKDVQAFISTDASYITINSRGASCGNILQDSTCFASLNITVSSLSPSPYFAPLTLSTNTQDGYSFTDEFVFTVGEPSFFDDMENGAVGWTHGGTQDSWGLTQNISHSFSHSWYCGNQQTWSYENSMNCWLLSPKFVLQPNCWLSFWAWYDVTIYGVDGLYVEIGDGTHWDTLDFIGSGGALDSLYYHTRNNQTESLYDLSSYTYGCTLQARFSFVSDAYDVAEGFYLDDVKMGPYVAEPALHEFGLIIDDSLYNNNGVLDPGEKVNIAISLINDGTVEAKGVTGILRIDDPYVHVLSNSGYFGDIPAKSTGNNSETPFCIMCDTVTPYRHLPRFNLYINANNDTYNNASAFTVKVGCGKLGKDLGNDWRKYSYDLSLETYSSIATEADIMPSFITLKSYPNPVRKETRLEYALPFKGNVKLNIYNLAGQLIKKLVSSEKSPGNYVVCWDGKDSAGELVRAGVYFCQLVTQSANRMLETESYTLTQKIIILR